MKKKLLLLVLTSIAIFFVLRNLYKTNLTSSNTDQLIERDQEETEAATDAAGAAQFELRMTKDPKTGKIPDGIREAALLEAERNYQQQQITQNSVLANTYNFQGPNNLGGRNRSIVYDVRYNGGANQTIMSGGVSGGIYKSIDDGATWIRKSPTSSIYSVTSIAQDPRVGNQDTWYYATGEALGNSPSATGAFYLGDGIYKSIDNGETWTKLTASNTGALETFDRRQDLITRVVVNPTNGDVFMAALDGIYRSTNGGTTWGIVLFSNAGSIGSAMGTDLVVTSAGRFYAAFPGANNAAPLNAPGIWTSTTGASASWGKIAGDSSLTNPVGWNTNTNYGRIVLAVPPSAEDSLYAIYYNNIDNSSCPGSVAEAELFRWRQSTTTWTDLSANLPNEAGCSVGNDPFSVQGGYDLLMFVKPGSPNTVFIGGTNIYRSTDGFTSTGNTTRIGGYANASGYSLYTNSHPDIHAVAFRPGSPNIMLCGNDGGIQRTTDNTAVTVSWTPINTGFNTYQYYYVAIDPRNANAKVLGGAQDNGSTRNVGGAGINFESIFGGDGVSVALSNDILGNTYEYVGFQNGDIFRRNALSAPNTGSNIRPATSVNDGLFITLFQVDPDNTDTLYYINESSLYRNVSASTATSLNWTDMTGIATAVAPNFITALATTRGAYNPATASLFIATENGRLYRLNNPANAAAATAPVDITGASFPTGYISSVAVNPRNDDTVMVTFSNYTVANLPIANIWWTGNANAASPTWTNIERNLTLPSIRSSVIARTSLGIEYFVGTSVGMYNTTNPLTTNWAQEGAATIGNAVVSSFALRTIDNNLLVGTHGYGMWKTALTLALPVNLVDFTGKAVNKINKLNWVTDQEQNNYGFDIERKYTNEINFSKIGFVKGKNSLNKNYYEFDDGIIDLGKENVQYRLKQIDLDQKFKYSNVITINRKGSVKFVEYISVVGNALFVRFNNNNADQTVEARFFDVSGRLLKKQQLSRQSQQLDISSLPAGAYVVEFTSSTQEKHTQKILKK